MPVCIQSGKEILNRLRQESFSKDTEIKLQNHPYVRAAENGTLTLEQRKAFIWEQYYIQRSDAISFAALAGHSSTLLAKLSNTSHEMSEITLPDCPRSCSSPGSSTDLFHFLFGGELHAYRLLVKAAAGFGVKDISDKNIKQIQLYESSPLCQAYPSCWSRLALSKKRAAGAAAAAVNFPAWGQMCMRLSKALSQIEGETEELDFLNFFATPIENLDEMAAEIIEEENASFEDVRDTVRLLQKYEIMFWDGLLQESYQKIVS